MAEGFEPSITGLTIRRLTNLATPQKARMKAEGWEMKSAALQLNGHALTSAFIPHVFDLEATKGVELLSSGLQDRRSVIQLSYIAANLVDWEGFKPSQEVCRTSMLSVTSPARGICRLTLDVGHFSFVIWNTQFANLSVSKSCPRSRNSISAACDRKNGE